MGPNFLHTHEWQALCNTDPLRDKTGPAIKQRLHKVRESKIIYLGSSIAIVDTYGSMKEVLPFPWPWLISEGHLSLHPHQPFLIKFALHLSVRHESRHVQQMPEVGITLKVEVYRLYLVLPKP